MLDKAQNEMLAILAQESEKNGEGSPGSSGAPWKMIGLEGLGSPRSSNTRYTQDSMRKILVTLVEQRQPQSLDELIEWLKFCGDITAVRGFVRQIARFIEERPRHNCEPSSYYILSAMLTRCLTTCEAMRDFGNIRTIMNTSLMLYGPTMVPYSKAFAYANMPLFRMHKQIMRISRQCRGILQDMVCHINCICIVHKQDHVFISFDVSAIWQSTAYWISVLRQNCDDATSDLHMNDEDPSEQHYTLLNKVVPANI